MPYPTGDINQDGIVDSIDLSLLVASWGSSAMAEDLNSDGIVDSVDLSILVSNWAATGEPSSGIEGNGNSQSARWLERIY
jgi:hypothetical protein